jgi:ribonucleotide reductase alpha subunit
MFVEKPKLDVEIKVYSKKNCNFCKLAKMLLQNYEIEFDEICIDDDIKIATILNEDPEVVITVPQIFLNDQRIGGYEELKAYLQPKYNFDKLKDITKVICKNLNKVIDVNFYPTKEGRFSNLKHRPIGIGVQGLADTYFKMRFPFESEEAHNLNKEIFETIYYGALEASMELSKQRGEELEKHMDYLDDMTKSKLA